MNIKQPLSSILPLTEDEQTIKDLKYYSESLNTLANIGTYLLEYEADTVHNHPEATGAVIGLLRRIIEVLDAIATLILQGCIVSSMSQTRILMELELQLDFLLKDRNDIDRKARYIFIAELHSVIVNAKRLLQKPDIERWVSIPEINARIIEYQSRIDYSGFDSIRANYQRKVTMRDGTNRMKLSSQKWYNLSDDIQTVSALIQALNKEWYEDIYSELSDYVHSSNLMADTVYRNNDDVFIHKIRNTEGANYVTTTIIRLALRAYRLVNDRRSQAQKGEFIYALREFRETYPSVYPRLL